MKDSCLKGWGFPSKMWKYTWNFALAPHYLCVKINVGHLPRLQSSEMQPANQLDQPSNLYFTTNKCKKCKTCSSNVMDISTRFPSPPHPKKRQKGNGMTWVSTFPRLRKVVSLRADLPEGRPKLAHDLSEHDTIDTTMGPHRFLKLQYGYQTSIKKQDSNSVQIWMLPLYTYFYCGVNKSSFMFFLILPGLDVQRWDRFCDRLSTSRHLASLR